MSQALDELIIKERHRREGLRNKRRPMYWWQESGKLDPPLNDIWCDYCFAYYGVPHTTLHSEPGYCKNISRAMNGDRQCACVECVCAEKIGGEGSLASRITQA